MKLISGERAPASRSRAARAAHSLPPPGPPPTSPDLPPPELDAGSPTEGKEGGGRDLFSSSQFVEVRSVGFGWWKGRTGWWPGLQIRPRGGWIWCSLPRISHGHPPADPPAAARSSLVIPRPPDPASKCADPAGGALPGAVAAGRACTGTPAGRRAMPDLGEQVGSSL